MLILLLELAPPALFLAAAHIVLSHPPQDVLLSAPVGCEARADGEDGDTDGKSCAHRAILQVIHASPMIGVTMPRYWIKYPIERQTAAGSFRSIIIL